jgi:hypothetical protein
MQVHDRNVIATTYGLGWRVKCRIYRQGRRISRQDCAHWQKWCRLVVEDIFLESLLRRRWRCQYNSAMKSDDEGSTPPASTISEEKRVSQACPGRHFLCASATFSAVQAALSLERWPGPALGHTQLVRNG